MILQNKSFHMGFSFWKKKKKTEQNKTKTKKNNTKKKKTLRYGFLFSTKTILKNELVKPVSFRYLNIFNPKGQTVHPYQEII